MLANSLKMQLQVMLNNKAIAVSLFIIVGVILTNYFLNVFIYVGRDILQMYNPLTLLTLSSEGRANLPFMQLYPFLIILPAGFSYLADKNSQEIVYIQAKVGSQAYYLGKLLAVFTLTFLVFTVPFLIEIILNSITFPLNATGRLFMQSIHDPAFLNLLSRQFLVDFYLLSPYLYTVFFTLVFGFVSGILATFAVALSLVLPIKFQLFVLLPIYVALDLLTMVGQIFPLGVTANYMFYLSIFSVSPKSSLSYVLTLLFLISMTAIIFTVKKRGDTL